MRTLLIGFLAFTVVGTCLEARQTASLETMLERLGNYLRDYESQLSSIVADERFDQRVVFTRAYTGGLPKTDDERKRLESEIGFIRLPGGVDWLGFRDVRKINGKPLQASKRRVADVLASQADVMVQAKAVADASAEHNLGAPRTTNVPTAALDIIHPSRFAAHQFQLRGEETIRRTRTVVLEFTEKQRPTIVRDPGGQDLISRGRVWIEPSSGAVWRIDWIYEVDERLALTQGPTKLSVDFAPNEQLGMMVPVQMREVFSAFGGLDARGDGVAIYSNFRRFGTGGRIVPQQP
jgi:hypothetical protein